MNTKTPVLLLALLLISSTALAVPALAAVTTLTTDKALYVPGDAMTVSGTVSPVQAGYDVGIRVTNPAGGLWGIAQVTPTPTTGAFSVVVSTFTAADPAGPYTVTARYAGEERQVTVQYAGGPPAPAVGAAPQLVQVSVSIGDVFTPGETARVYILVTFNGSLVEPTQWVQKHVFRPDGAVDALGGPIRIHDGWYYINYAVPDVAGVYGVHVAASASGTSNSGQASFAVTKSLATATQVSDAQAAITSAIGSAQAAITSAVSDARSAITSAIGSAQSAILTGVERSIGDAQSAITSTVSNAVGGAQSSITSAVNAARDTLNSAVSGVRGDISAMKASLTSMEAGVGQASTFLLVVLAITVITLVVTLAILVRRVR